MGPQIKNYLSVTKKEWNGMVVFIILIAMVLLAPYMYRVNGKDNTINFKAFDKAKAGADKTDDRIAGEGDFTGKWNDAPVTLFKFNPNKLPVDSWVKLGLTIH